MTAADLFGGALPAASAPPPSASVAWLKAAGGRFAGSLPRGYRLVRVRRAPASPKSAAHVAGWRTRERARRAALAAHLAALGASGVRLGERALAIIGEEA